MSSRNYTQAFNTNYGGLSYSLPLIGTQNGVQAHTRDLTSVQSSMLSYTTSNTSVSSPNWNSSVELQFSPEEFVNFEIPVFPDDEESSSDASSLYRASKKISKVSPASQVGENTHKASQKRSKRGRNPWTPKEDAKLMELMKKYGQSWAMISSCLEGRTGKQVRDRYLNKLRPNIKCGDWKPEEDELLVKLCKEIGNRWSLIATHLPGRTEGQVKNRYYSYIKKRLLPDGTLCQTNNVSRNTSEGLNSFAASPQVEEEFNYDFVQDFDFNNFNACPMTFPVEAPVSNGMVKKAAYIVEEEISEQSTTQSSNSSIAANSPYRVAPVDPTDVISYDTLDIPLYKQQSTVFHVAPIQHDSQVDEMLNNLTGNYFSAETPNVDSFFSDELRTQNNASVPSDERMTQLSKRKAYLELALAKTLKELKNL